MSPSAGTPDVLDLLIEQYQAVPAPTPGAELLARMDAGRVGSVVAVHGQDDGDTDRAAVIPFAPRPRMRYLLAATMATFVAMSGLAVAGVLPDGLQRQVASVASEFGIDLPSPDSGSTPPAPDGSPRGSGGTQGTGGTSNSPTPGTGGGAGTPTTSSPGGLVPGLPPLSVPPTTVPPTLGVPNLPPVSVPPFTLPPSLPPASTPPGLGIPPAALPPIPLPIPQPPIPLPIPQPPISLPLTLPPLGLPGL
jgi:hypothetical protein